MLQKDTIYAKPCKHFFILYVSWGHTQLFLKSVRLSTEGLAKPKVAFLRQVALRRKTNNKDTFNEQECLISHDISTQML